MEVHTASGWTLWIRLLALSLLVSVYLTLAGCRSNGQLTPPMPISSEGGDDRPVLVLAPSPAITLPSVTRVPVTAATWTPMPSATPTRLPTRTLVPSPTWTPSSTPDLRRALLAFVSDVTGNDDIYLFDPKTGQMANLTHRDGEDRDPTFTSDGHSLVFRTNVHGAWAFEQLDLGTGRLAPLREERGDATSYEGGLSWSRVDRYQYVYESYHDGNLDLYVRTASGTENSLTRHRAGDYGPAWRPGAPEIAFASWREGQKDLYLIGADGEGLVRLTTDTTDEEEPTWHPDGQSLVFVRWEDYNANLYELQMASGAMRALTADPYPDRSPVYGPDGTLFWVRYVPGEPFELHDPYRSGRWRLWAREPDGREGPVPFPIDEMDVYAPAAGFAVWPEGLFPQLVLPTPVPAPTLGPLVELDISCAGGNPKLNSRIEGAYQGWRADLLAQTGYDFLGTVSDVYRPLGYAGSNYSQLSWHRTGRAVDLLFEWYEEGDRHNRLVVTREDLGAQTYWRLFLLARKQDGSMGEPLTVAPWTFWFNLNPAAEPQAYAAGGRPAAIPAGYYGDVTRLAKRHGWHRIASYKEVDFDWRTNSVGREFWHYQRTDGLTWWKAMSQIYPDDVLDQYYGWTVCVDKLGLDPTWLYGKGIPTPTPTQSP